MGKDNGRPGAFLQWSSQAAACWELLLRPTSKELVKCEKVPFYGLTVRTIVIVALDNVRDMITRSGLFIGSEFKVICHVFSPIGRDTD